MGGRERERDPQHANNDNASPQSCDLNKFNQLDQIPLVTRIHLIVKMFRYSSALNCRGGESNKQGGWVFQKNILKWWGHDQMTPGNIETIPWRGGGLLIKWGRGGYDFYISTFTGRD